MRVKTKQIPIGFTPRLREMIEEMMVSKGYNTISSVVQQAIIEMHGNVFKDYVMAKKNRFESSNVGELKKTNQTNKLVGVCDLLEGEVIDKNGAMYCVYYTYNRKNRYEQEVPVDTLNKTHIEKQYFPSKKEIKQLQKAKGVNY